MDEKNRKFLVIGDHGRPCYLRSSRYSSHPGDPDGLDSTALIVSGQKSLTAPELAIR